MRGTITEATHETLPCRSPWRLCLPRRWPTAPRDAGFEDVRRNVADRTKVELVRWDQGTDADRQAQASVDALLAMELTPDSAVQVVLLNNADLQATYEDLGVAQADLVAPACCGIRCSTPT